MTYPEPPVNVRLEFAGGEQIPVDCTYVGHLGDEYGHVWQVLNPRPTVLPVAILADLIPPDTSITVMGSLE